MNKRIKILFIFIFLFGLTGCGPKTTRISGTVTSGGVGLNDLVILLQPISGDALTSEAAFGKTNSSGRFDLLTIFGKKPGLAPGEYSVTLSWKDPNPPPENKPPNPCPYNIPSTATNGSFRYMVGTNGAQTLSLELSNMSN